jgi:hypothetical protein
MIASWMVGLEKMTGPLALSAPAHLVDVERQEAAIGVLDKLTHQHSDVA